MAIYLGENKLTGTGVQVDDALSSTSTNPVENKAVTEALTDVGYSEWQKPADWIDIRSGAQPNSVYFLIGHSADYTQFPKLSVRANIANSGSYDVYIDGIKYATTAHNTATDIDWETLALATGKATTFPTSLVTHIVRITPTLSTNTISFVAVRKHSQAASGRAQLGVLWAHYNISNTIEMYNAFCTYDTNYQPYLVAITAKNDCIKTTGTINGIWNSGSDHSTYCSSYIAHLPTFEGQDATQTVNGARLGPTDTNVKKLVLSGDNKYIIGGNYAFTSSYKLQEIVCNNLTISGNARYTFNDNYALKRLPSIDYTAATDMQNFLTNAYSLEPTILDLSSATGLTRLGIFGSSTRRIDGLKGLTVSSSAPFSNTNSPQLNVSYTGLDRAALVNLFNSLPTVTDSQVCNITGATGANDLTAEDLAIATGKGWSITR